MSISTKFGQFFVPETEETMLTLHIHDGATPLTNVDWEPKNGVLDQEDLEKQGIDTSVLVPGAPKVDALGSCTENANMSGLSNVLSEADYLAFTGATSYDDVIGIEKHAIVCYHEVGLLMGKDKGWPPTDGGSSGVYIVKQDQGFKVVDGATIAHGAQNIVSLLQSGGLLTGQPFLNAWMEPNAQGFIDGNGSSSTLEKQIKQGVAGGHETYLSAIEEIALSATGTVIPEKTIIRFRNSWTKSWGDNGSYRAHLSTYIALGSYCDFRQLKPLVAA